MATGRPYKAEELAEIKRTMIDGQLAKTPVGVLFETLAKACNRSPNAIRKICRKRDFTDKPRDVNMRACNTDEPMGLDRHQITHEQMMGADDAFCARMSKAIKLGKERAQEGVTRTPCTLAPRRICPDPHIYIRSSSYFVGVEGEDAH